MQIDAGLDETRAQIDMIPLIDIVFLLLVFFIYAMLSMSVHKGIRVQLPGVRSAARPPEQHVTVSVDRQNNVYVDEQQIALDDVARAVALLSRGDQRPAIYVNADKGSNLGVVVGVLDRLRSAGYAEMSLACKEESP